MKSFTLAVATGLLVLLAATGATADNEGRIYGKIITVDGDTFEGLIRWDKNEANWVDVLNGNKELDESVYDEFSSERRRKYSDRGAKVEFFGLTISRDDGSVFNFSNSAESGMRFGHIKRLEVIGDDEALIILKSGEEVELSGGSTDIGTGIREIVIEDPDEGEIEFVWDDIEAIEFRSSRTDMQSNFGERLYGTLTTRRGETFTGYVCWDMDEIFTEDILDGSERNRSRKIDFGKISAIERYSSNGAMVTLANGDELLLRETNDVDDGNRGIVIGDPGFGQVTVDWDEFERLEFTRPSREVRYDDFDGGHKIYGTIYTEDGESYTGEIIWDADERYTWEILDGEYHDVEFDVEFGLIRMIEKKSYRSSLVTVLDGREFRLRGSNDVDEDNKGIFVKTDAGDRIEVDWDDFDRVEFRR
jgi:hypothetical protein